MELLINGIGWVGTFLVVLAYYLVSTKKVEGNGYTYQVMNLFGALCVGTNVFYMHAWPSVALQVIWGLISLVTIVSIKRKSM